MTKIWKRPISLEEISGIRKKTLVELMGIEFTEVGDDFLSGRMPVDERTKQPYGILHGGASCVLAETLGSIAANYCIDQDNQICVGIDIHTSHIKMANKGFVLGTAKPIHLGNRIQIWEIKIIDEHEKLISLTRLTLAVLPKGQSEETDKKA